MKKYNITAMLLALLFVLSASVDAQRVRYTVQLEATSDIEAAREKLGRFKQQGIEVYIVRSDVPGKGTFFRLRTGNFPTQQQARDHGADLKKRGIVSDYFIAPYEEPRKDWSAGPAEKQPVPPAAAAKQPKSDPKPAPPAAEKAPVETANSAGFVTFSDSEYGFSFDHPKYWEGGRFLPNELDAQKIDAGARFKSYQDAAFLNVIWNNVDKANSPDNDNDLIVDVILKSMSASEGTQQLTETSRKVVNENGNIKTLLGLQAVFRTKAQQDPLDFLGRAVIIRSSKGILLAVAFYSKQAQPQVAQIAEQIIASTRVQN